MAFNTGNPVGSTDPRDLIDNAPNLDRAVNSSDATWTDRLGQVRPTLKRLETEYPLAGVHAEQAALSQVAAEQAKASAEQSATDAAGKVTEAEAAKNQAALEADRSEAARDAAFVNADLYETTSEGVAATAEGEQFQVLSTDGLEYIRYLHDAGGVATALPGRYPSREALLPGRLIRSQQQNLYDGELLPYVIDNLGVFSPSPAAGSAVFPVTAGRAYTITRSSPTARFRVATFASKPESLSTATRYVLPANNADKFEGSSTLPYSFKAEPGETYAAVYLVTSNSAPPENLFIAEGYSDEVSRVQRMSEFVFPEPVIAPNIVPGKNLFDGKWVQGTLDGDVGGSPVLTSYEGKYFLIGVSPNTTYTISKAASNRFAIATWSFNLNGGVYLFRDDTLNKYTLTTGEDVAWIAVYALNGAGDPPFVQVERSDAETEWETFGYKLKPLAAPYIIKSGNSVPGLDVDLSGGEDATEAMNYYLLQRAGRSAPLPEGRIKVTGTIYVDGETSVVGHGRSTEIFLGDNYSLDPVAWRDSLVYPIMRTSAGADHAVFRNFLLVGNKTALVNQLQFGLAAVDADHASIEGVGVEYINYFPSSAQGLLPLSFNLAFLRSNHGVVRGGLYRFGGYENIGTEDSKDILFDGVKAGIGWRTSVQFHRGSEDIRWVGGSIYQDSPAAHSALTMHGRVDNPVLGVLIDGLILKSTVDLGYSEYAGGLQAVEAHEHEVTISNSRIITNNTAISGLTGSVGGPNPACKDWKILGSMLKGARGLKFNGSTRMQVDNVSIDSTDTAIMLWGSTSSIGKVDFLNNSEVIR